MKYTNKKKMCFTIIIDKYKDRNSTRSRNMERYVIPTMLYSNYSVNNRAVLKQGILGNNL